MICYKNHSYTKQSNEKNTLFDEKYRQVRVFYLITKITDYTTTIDLLGLNVWYPYLDE